MGKLSFGIDSNSRLKKKVISEATVFGYFFSSAHTGRMTFLQLMRLLTHLIRALHTGRVLEQEQAGVVNNGDPVDPS